MKPEVLTMFTRILFVMTFATGLMRAENRSILPRNLQGIGIDQRIGSQVPLNTVFLAENGTAVTLQSIFGGKPVLLAPVYYRCPMLCSQVLHGVVAALRPLSLKPGRDFEVLAISFDPADTPAEAAEKRTEYAKSYSRRAGTTGWHFLVGKQASIDAVMQAIGFHYRWDPVNKMFIHASGVLILTPEGNVARYAYGVEYEPKDLKLGLIEASHNRIGSPVDQILLFCYHYDPKTGKYSSAVIATLKISAVLMLAMMAAGMFFLWRQDLRGNKELKEVRRV